MQELYTGNTAALPVAIYEGKADMGGLLKNWFFSYAGNLVGSVAMAWLVYQSGVFSTSQVMQNLAVAKTSLPWTTVSMLQTKPGVNWSNAMVGTA